MAQTKEESKAVNKKRKREKLPIEKLPPADSGYNCKFARALGSVDWHTREQGLQALTIWLTRNEVSDQDLSKIWKALFFCFWHADKAPVQNELAERLAAILPKLSEQSALHYFKIFARTMQREWFGIDKLRLDKFMVLARKFLHQVYAHLQSTGWSLTATAAYSQFLLEEVLAPSDADPSAGFSLHVADIAVQELLSACEDSPVPAPALQALLEPFCQSLARTRRASLLFRLQDGVFERLLEGAGQGALAHLDTQQLSAHLFHLGAQEGMKAKNRQMCYSLSRAFELVGSKRLKRAAQDSARPAAQLSGVSPEEAQGRKQDASAGSFMKDGTALTSAAAAQPQAGRPGKVGARKQKPAARAKELQSAEPGGPPSSVGAQASEEAGSPKPKKKQVLREASEQPETPLPHSNGSTTRESTGMAPKAKAAGASGRAAGGGLSQQDAARLVNAALNSEPMAGSAPALGGINTKAKKQRLSLPAGGSKAQKQRRQTLPARPLQAEAALPAQQPGSVSKAESPRHAAVSLAEARGAVSANGSALTDSQRKKVKFALKRNLYFAKGGPVPPADVRTPPTAKPKGSALKRPSSLAKAPRNPKGHPKAKTALLF